VEKIRIQAQKELDEKRLTVEKYQAKAELEKEQRETLSAIKSHCPSCSAPNKEKLRECAFCHSPLI